MDFKKLYETVSEQTFRLKRALGNSAVPGRAIEQTKNILYNNVEDIEAALKFASEASKKIEVLEVELADAERELDELNKQAKSKKTTTKNKTLATADEQQG